MITEKTEPSIRRDAYRKQFTLVSNTPINDDRLTGDLLGLLVYLLSKPDDWDTKPSHLAAMGRFGARNKVYRDLTQLRALGYADMAKLPDGTAVWTIYESPTQAQPEAPQQAAPDPQNGDRNRTQNGHTIPNTDNSILSDISIAASPKKRQPYPHDFELTWRAYPRRLGTESKRKAFDQWQRRIREGYTVDGLHRAAGAYARHIEKTGNAGTSFIMQPERFFGPGCHFEKFFDEEFDQALTEAIQQARGNAASQPA